MDYHKTSCQVVAFARAAEPSLGADAAADASGRERSDDAEDEDEDMDEKEKKARSRWLIGGGKDGRVSIWVLMDFQKR